MGSLATRHFFSRRVLRWAGFSAGAVFALAAAISWWITGKLVSPAPGHIGRCPSGLVAQTVSIGSDSGSSLSGWYISGAPEKGTVVLLHAIRGSRLQMVDRARLLNQHGYSVLLIDLQAHGESPGEHITAGHLERLDARAAVRFAGERKPKRPVAVIGVSLGGAAAVLASPLGIDAAILESVYPTIDEAIDNRVRMRLGRFAPVATQLLLLQLKPRLGISPSLLRPIEHINQIGCPVLVMSGRDDRHTTVAETKRLFRSASKPRQLAIIEGAAHVDLCAFNPTLYADLALSFLSEHLDSDSGDSPTPLETAMSGSAESP